MHGCADGSQYSVSVGSSSSNLVVREPLIWDTTSLTVCWQDEGREVEKGWIRDALAQSWQADTNVRLSGFHQCADGPARIHIELREFDETMHGNTPTYVLGYGGNSIDGVPSGMVLDMFDRAPVMVGGQMSFGGYCPLPSRERCIKALAVHEFAHVLGFGHENDRPDSDKPANWSCGTTVPDGGVEPTTVGSQFGAPYDQLSATEYCNPMRWQGDTLLSAMDIWGTDLYYSSKHPIAGVSRRSDRLDVYFRNPDGVFRTMSWNGTNWTPISTLSAPHGIAMTSPPTVASWGGSHVEVFARGMDGALWHKRFSSNWGSWESLGGSIGSQPVVVARASNRLNVFVRGVDRTLWSRTWNGSAWEGWQDHGGAVIGRPVAVARDANHVDVFMRGTDNALWRFSGDGTTQGWTGWTRIGGTMTSNPSAASRSSDTIDVVYVGGNNELRRRVYTASTNSWVNQGYGGVIVGDPEIVTARNGTTRFDIFFRGLDDGLWHFEGNGSSGNFVQLGMNLKADPAPVLWSTGRIDVFLRGSDDALWVRSRNPGQSWSFQSFGSVIQ